MFYLAVKQIHIICVAISIVGFCLRVMLITRNSEWAGRRWFRILPHVNDSVLLAAALMLAGMSGQYPFLDAWLTAKFFGLIAYIVLGALALGADRTPVFRLTVASAAAAVYFWMISVAVARHPLGAFLGIST